MENIQFLVIVCSSLLLFGVLALVTVLYYLNTKKRELFNKN